MKASRKHLSAKGLLNVIHARFKKINSPREVSERSNSITLTDCLMSGLAMFGLKFPSLLKFDESKDEGRVKHNLRTLYHVNRAPSDTYMRERCDEVEPNALRKTYKTLFACVQRGKGLEEFEYLDKHYLLAGDGTNFFASSSTHCKNCCVAHHNKCGIKFTLNLYKNNFKKNSYVLVKAPKQIWELYYINYKKEKIRIELNAINGLTEILSNKSRKNLSKDEKTAIQGILTSYYRREHPEEQVTYYHNMFCAAIVHPDKKIVLPFAPEPVMKTDGSTKNDCEYHASKRLYADARREHPHLKFIVVEDSLASNVPHLKMLKELDMRCIIGVKPGSHKALFKLVESSTCNEYQHQTEDGVTHCYRYLNEIPLNSSHPDFKVNFIEYWETNEKGDTQHFSWITDITITNENTYHIMRGGRSNWRIENNTFNTLKNQDYHFSHNFGHGYRNLCTIFGMLMMLAFFVDQVQELSCHLFKNARTRFKSRTSLWEKIRGMFKEFLIESWDDLFKSIAHGYNEILLVPNTS